MEEAQFTRDEIENFRSQHLRADENPHGIFPSHPQQQFFFNIWTSICGNNLFGPDILPNRLPGQNYKAFLKNNMPEFLAHVSLIIHQELYFMRHGTLTHFSPVAYRYLYLDK
jgi:hypothetical protein